VQQPGSVGTLAAKDRIGGAGSGPAEFRRGDPPHPAAEPRLFEDRVGELGPGALAFSGEVPGPARPVDQFPDRGGQMPNVGRAAALVVDHRNLGALGPEPEHRPDEVIARRPVEPGAADNPAVADQPLALEFRTAVGRDRSRLVRLEVGLALGAVEDVVGREVDDGRPELNNVVGSGNIDSRGLIGLGLGTVDVGPGGRVEDEIGPVPELDRSGDIELGASSRVRLREDFGERTAELAARSRDQDASRSRADRIGDCVLQR
jgi:hypothetical protein